MSHRVGAAVAACVLSCVPSVVLAQESRPPLTSGDPTAVLPPTSNAQAPLETRQAEQQSRPVAPRQEPPGADSFVLARATFRNSGVLNEAQLEPAWSGFRGRAVGLRELREIAAAAEGLYAAAGYPFVAVLVPQQEVADGAVSFEVVEGRISEVTVLGPNPVARRQAAASFERLVDVTPLSLADVERTYELAQEIPGLTMVGSLRRGSTLGGMDLVLQTQRRAWRFYGNLNNFYADPVGPWGVLFGADYSGTSLYGDQTSVQLFSTVDFDEQQVVRLSHTRRLNASGTSVSGTLLFAQASPQGAVAPLDLATDVFAARFELAQPFVARSNLTVGGALALEVTDQETLVFGNIGLTEDRLRILSARLFGRWGQEDERFMHWDVELRQGLDGLGASRSDDVFLSRFGADPQATVLRGDFRGELDGPADTRLAWRVQGQWSNSSLTAPEEFAVGNLTVGRGYDPGASFGDSAVALSGEVRWGPYQVRPWVRLVPYVFADAVEVWNHEDFAPNERWVSSVGAGLRFEFPDRARLDVFYAQPLSEPLGLGEGRPNGRLYVNLTVALPDAFEGIGRVFRGGVSR